MNKLTRLKQVMVFIDVDLNAWFDWLEAKKWAKIYHPAWVQFAVQRKRPEIRETYRKKILNEYQNKHWLM